MQGVLFIKRDHGPQPFCAFQITLCKFDLFEKFEMGKPERSINTKTIKTLDQRFGSFVLLYVFSCPLLSAPV